MIMIRTFSIRIATPSDANALTNLYLASRQEYISFAPLIHSDSAVQQWIQDVLIPTSQVWLVEHEGVIIGMMAIAEKQGINWIEQLYVLPKEVGQGVGSFLITKAKALQLPLRLHTFQENLNARRFYEKHTCKILEFTDGSGNEEHCPDMLYEWKPSIP